jgi:hypothetical protein
MSGVRILSFPIFLCVLVLICCCKEANAERGRKCEGIDSLDQARDKKRDIMKNEERKNNRPHCKDEL